MYKLLKSIAKENVDEDLFQMHIVLMWYKNNLWRKLCKTAEIFMQMPNGSKLAK